MFLLYALRPFRVYDIYFVTHWILFRKQKEGKHYVGSMSFYELLTDTGMHVVILRN